MSLHQALLQTILTTIVGVCVGAYVRRGLRLNRERIERLLEGMEGVVTLQTKRARVDPRDYRKGIAAAFGGVLAVLLTWASTDGVLAELLTPLVPSELRPAVGAAAGALAILAGVVLARNGPRPPVASEPAATLPEPAPPAAASPVEDPTDGILAAVVSPPAGLVLAPAAASAPAPVAVTNATAGADQAPTTGPFWAGVTPTEPTSSTGIVTLRPLPTSSPL